MTPRTGSAARSEQWCVVDASVWVSRFLPPDVNHAVSRLWLYRHLRAGGRVIAPTLLLVETAGALARRTGDQAGAMTIASRLRRLPRVRWVALDGASRDDAARLAIQLGLRGADAVYVAVARRLGVPLVSWDSEQIARAAATAPTL